MDIDYYRESKTSAKETADAIMQEIIALKEKYQNE